MDQNNQQRVIFEADEARRTIQSYQTQQQSAPKIVQLVMKLSAGRITDEKQAQFILLIAVVVIIIVSIFLFFHTGHSPKELTAELLAIIRRMPVNHRR